MDTPQYACLVCHDDCSQTPVSTCTTCCALMCPDCVSKWVSENTCAGMGLACPRCRSTCKLDTMLPLIDTFKVLGLKLDMGADEVVHKMLCTRDIAFLPHGIPGISCGRTDALFVRGGRDVPPALCKLACNAVMQIAGDEVLMVAHKLTPLHNTNAEAADGPEPKVYCIARDLSLQRVLEVAKPVSCQVERICHQNAHANRGSPAASVGELVAQCRDRTLPEGVGRNVLQRELNRERYDQTSSLIDRALNKILGGVTASDINQLRWLFEMAVPQRT